MILQTMTYAEKHREAVKICPYLYRYAESWAKSNARILNKTKVFPYCYQGDIDLTDKGYGRWTVLIIIESKSNMRKGIATFRMYQTFYVSRAQNEENNGVGIYEIVPSDSGDIRFEEYTPHYFNRVRERYIEERGIVQPSFSALVRRLTCDHWTSMEETMKTLKYEKDSTGHYALVKDTEHGRKDGFDNLAVYHSDGLSLGVSSEERDYFLYLTYVPNSMLYEEQVERQKRDLAELRHYELNQRYDPFARYGNVEMRPYGRNVLPR